MCLLCLMIAITVAAPATAGEHVVTVTYFDAHSVDPDLEPLGRGVADMLITDLQRGEAASAWSSATGSTRSSPS